LKTKSKIQKPKYKSVVCNTMLLLWWCKHTMVCAQII